MRVSFIKSLIDSKNPDSQIATVWIEKTDAENIANQDLSPEEWEVIVDSFCNHDWLNQIVDEIMENLVTDAIENRKKDK